jgi:3D (Asp-Asp-Asp) domain-containing protein
MLIKTTWLCAAAFGASLWLGGCASRPLPKYEKPVARARVQQVRTTAYTHTEADHLKYGRRTALGTPLRSGPVKSAAADWSRWPAGTVFRIIETGEIYEVDDYGWALAGTNTVDLYKPSRAAMNAWGVRRVTIENLAWGDPDRSLQILRARSRHKHVRRMLTQLERRYAEHRRPLEGVPSAGEFARFEPEIRPAEPAVRAAEPVAPVAPVAAAAPSSRPAQPLNPFLQTVR